MWSADGESIAYFDHTRADRYALTLRPSGGGRKTRVTGERFYDFGDPYDWATCA